MIKALVVGDPHFKPNNDKETSILVEKCHEIISLHQVDIVVVMGDILDSHNIAKIQPYMKAYKFLYTLATKLPVYLLIGNHDRPNNRTYLTEEHFFFPYKLSKVNNLHIVDNPIMETINGVNVGFVPYVPVGKFKAAVKQIPYREASVIFAHQEFAGCSYNGVKSTKGDVWSLNAPTVISGHIHDEQQIQDNLLYVGTPFQISFGESYDKSISIFTITPDKIRRKRIKLDIPVKASAKYYIKDIDRDKIAYYIEKNLIVKLTLMGTKAEIAKFKTSKYAAKLAKWNIEPHYAQVVKVKYVASDLNYMDYVYTKLNARQKDLIGSIQI